MDNINTKKSTLFNSSLEVLLSGAEFDKDSFEVFGSQRDQLAEAAETLSFPIMGQTFVFSGSKFVESLDNVKQLLEKNKGEGVVTAADLKPLLGFFDVLQKTEENKSITRGSLSGVSTTLRQLPVDWPRMDVYPGITAIIGQMFAGKTYFVQNDLDTDIVIRYGEPVEEIDGQKGVVQASHFVDAIASALLLSFFGKTVAIDSLRKLVFSIDGPAMQGGIVAVLFDMLTNVNNLFAAIGRHAVVTINPMMRDPEAIERFYELAGASTAGAILLSRSEPRKETFRTSKGRTTNTVSPGDAGFDIARERSLIGNAMDAGPVRGLNMQKLPDESVADNLDARFGEPAGSNESDNDQPTRTGVNFNL